MKKLALILSAMSLLIASGFPALGHVTLEQQESAIGGPTKLTFRLPHGCGDQPTIKVQVLIPEGFIAAKPMPKPSWTLEATQGAYSQTHDYFHGVKLSEGTKAVTWSGNLPSGFYDEFVVFGFVSKDLKPGSMLYFPVVQECPSDAHRWIEIPKPGQNAHDLKEPAPGVQLIQKK